MDSSDKDFLVIVVLLLYAPKILGWLQSPLATKKVELDSPMTCLTVLSHIKLWFMWFERVKHRIGESNLNFLAVEDGSMLPRILGASCQNTVASWESWTQAVGRIWPYRIFLWIQLIFFSRWRRQHLPQYPGDIKLELSGVIRILGVSSGESLTLLERCFFSSRKCNFLVKKII